MLTEDLSVFLADFGVPASTGAASGTVLFDMPDGEVLNGRMLSTGYLITFRTADFPALKHGDAVTVNGQAYQANDVRLLDDGIFSTAGLQK